MSAAAGGAEEPERTHLRFSAAGVSYAINVSRVREVVAHEPLTHVPGTPSWIAGMLNLRGTAVPVVDLAVRLGQPPVVPSRTSSVVVLALDADDGPVPMGLLVDEVSDVVTLEAAAIAPAQGGATPALVRGEVDVSGGRVSVLDANALLAAEAASGDAAGAGRRGC